MISAREGGKRLKGIAKASTVSIITVVYNNAAQLEKTILSIISQSSDDYEYIIIDGGSTDGTLDIIKKYEDKIDYWISEKDKGIYDAMNKGFSHAKGKYVWFMNSGDKIASEKTLEQVLNSSKNADVYYGETEFIDDSDKVLGTRTELTTRKLPVQMTWKDMKYGMVVSHQSIIVKRELASPYNLSYKCSADIDWVISSLKKSKSIVNAHVVLSRYLIEGFSIKNRKKCWRERFQVYKKHYGMFETCLVHIYILTRYAFYKILSKPNY